ncbi:MAG: glycosyltransferase [Betaproteobacteria bacterium]|nr:glycosyltransferase [Betaproteobacteria bacterium]NBT82393.1 glycosyltransferase [Betaproteobacteria bacterium]
MRVRGGNGVRDRAIESEVYRRVLTEASELGRTLCVAPHPDDEILGCGGLLTLLARLDLAMPSLILTRGEHAIEGDRNLREQESRQAASCLGLPEPMFRDLGDRQLRFEPSLIELIGQTLSELSVDTLLLPALSEPHPDHQVCALAGLAAASASSTCLRVMFYEDGATMHPNCWIDIDSVSELKWKAIGCFASQLQHEAYAEMATALSRVRAFGLRSGSTDQGKVQHAEAYFQVDMATYRARGPLFALPQWPWVRQRFNLANDPAQLPMVTVLIRSMNRPCLIEGLASVAAQTYRPIRLIIANASGTPHQRLGNLLESIPLQIINENGEVHFKRAQAANALLDALQRLTAADSQNPGLALFLDDDDLIDPDHIERLVATLERSPQSSAAYAGVRMIDESGALIGEYDLAWSYDRLVGINYIPIHAVLFRVEAVFRKAIRFNEDLPVLEDWAFWRTLAAEGGFTHCPGTSATYRQALGKSHVSDQSHEHYWRQWHRKLIEEAVADASPDDLSRCLQWHALALDESRLQLAARDVKERQLEETVKKLAAYEGRIAELERQIDAQHLESDRSNAYLKAAEASLAQVLSEQEAQLSKQALVYERELKNLQSELSGEAQKVVALQAQLQGVSQLAQRNFQTASELQAQLADEQARHQSQMADEQARSAEQSLQIEQSRREVQQLKAALLQIHQSKGWRLIQGLKRSIGRS